MQTEMYRGSPLMAYSFSRDGKSVFTWCRVSSVQRSEGRPRVIFIDRVCGIVRTILIDGIEGVIRIEPIDRVSRIVWIELIDRIEWIIRLIFINGVERIVWGKLVHRVKDVVVALILSVESGFRLCQCDDPGEQDYES